MEVNLSLIFLGGEVRFCVINPGDRLFSVGDHRREDAR